jgi:transcriptional regulator with XRE-family HTH domain
MDSLSDSATVEEVSVLADPPPNFGQLLHSRREEAGLTIAALASKAAVSRNTIVNLEQGLTAPSPQTLRRLMAVKALRLHEIGSGDQPTTRGLVY